MQRLILAWLAMMLMAMPIRAQGTEPVLPTGTDKCPVCGMFVAKYPDFLAQLVFKDGSRAFFDGAKDMFKYYLNLVKYNPGEKQEDVAAVYVTDYYDLKLVDGTKAYFVIGSTVYGPMGKELIPFEHEDAAQDFMVDHSGVATLRFRDVTLEALKALD
jgi:copper chaperone NosL